MKDERDCPACRVLMAADKALAAAGIDLIRSH